MHYAEQNNLGQLEEVLMVCSVGFGLWLFLERDRFPFRSWQGPVILPRARHACHQL